MCHIGHDQGVGRPRARAAASLQPILCNCLTLPVAGMQCATWQAHLRPGIGSLLQAVCQLGHAHRVGLPRPRAAASLQLAGAHAAALSRCWCLRQRLQQGAEHTCDQASEACCSLCARLAMTREWGVPEPELEPRCSWLDAEASCCRACLKRSSAHCCTAPCASSVCSSASGFCTEHLFVSE